LISVVTGAAGHVGVNLVRALLERGETVRVLCHRNRQGLDDCGAEVCDGDICQPQSLSAAFADADVVYHLAARISITGQGWEELERINVTGTRHVVEACLDARVSRLVHFSSIHALDPTPLDEMIDETRPRVSLPGTAPYDRSKALGELEVEYGLARGLNAVIINPTGIIGPGDYQPSHMGAAILSLARGRMPVLVDAGFNWVDVRDVVQAAITAAEAAPFGTSYLISGHWRNLSEIAAAVARVTGGPVPRLVSPYWLARLAAPLACRFDRLLGRRPMFTPFSLETLRQHRHVSHDKATRELGYHPRPFEETVADALYWFRDHGHLDALPHAGESS
jgi:dihydroflavonol-4-reductase